MHGLIYLVGLIVVILAVLSFFGLRGRHAHVDGKYHARGEKRYRATLPAMVADRAWRIRGDRAVLGTTDIRGHHRPRRHVGGADLA